MKCNKCGEECKDNQAFCLKCGNPIQVVPDFNLIEAELASNIGELMNEIDNEKADESLEEDNIQAAPYEDMEIKLVNIKRNDSDDGKTKVIGDIAELVSDIKDEKTKVDIADTEVENAEQVKKERISSEKRKQREEIARKKAKKKQIIIICSVFAVLAIAIVIFIVAAQSVKKTATSYEEYYNSAKNAYDDMNTEDAIDYALDALDKADTKDKKLEIRSLMNDIYVLAGQTGEDYADNLEAITELGSVNSEYYVALAKYYSDNGKYNNLTAFLRKVEDEKHLAALEQYIVEAPKADFESGEYGSFFAVTLSAKEGYTIYYTVDSRHPSNYGEPYIEPIQIAKEGETIIKAIAVNEKGVESDVVTYTYNIALEGSKAPVVTPSGGEFDDYTEIKIEVPEGAKAYYTWDGTIPDEKSELYEESIQMKRGINVLKVIIIDKYGIASEVAEASFNLQVKRVLTLNEAVTLIEETEKESYGGSFVVTATYDKTVTIDNDEYYIIVSTVTGEATDEDVITIYAVNTYNKKIEKATDVEGEYVIEKEEAEKPTE